MARNNISLSCYPKAPPRGYQGPWTIRWREDVIVNGTRERKPRKQNVSDKGARDALMARLRRALEAGEVYQPEARTVNTAASLEVAALAWLAWQASRGAKDSSRARYKGAIARIMRTIRAVKRIPADAVIPVSVLNVDLFAAIRIAWAAEDAAAVAAGTRRGTASVMRRYTLSCLLAAIWHYAASQPTTYPGIPAMVDQGLIVPPAPPPPRAPEAPTWPECDALVRRAYAVSADLGDIVAGLRLTGLRVSQILAIRRRAIDPVRRTLTVEAGKSAAEQAEMRKVPIPACLVALWTTRIAAVGAGGEALLFGGGIHREAHRHRQITAIWRAAEAAGEVRPGLLRPLSRRIGRPNHAFRAAYMAGLQAITVEVDGAPMQRVPDRTIDFLVGHRPIDVRGRHYAPPSWRALEAAVALVPPIDFGTAGGNVVTGPW